MKKMKRVLVALLSCLTAFACLAGTVACGKDKAKDSASTPNTSVSESVADSSSEEVADSSVEEGSSEEVVDSSSEEESSEVVDSSVEEDSSSEEVETPHDCAKDGHVMGYNEEKLPTCTEDGYPAYYGCSECGYGKVQIAFPNRADFATYEEYLQAWEIYNYYQKEYAAFGEHAWAEEAVKAVEPTCCEPGKLAYYECTLCDAVSKFGDVACEEEDLVIPATGAHKYVEYTVAVAATCEDDGCTEGWVCEKGGFVDSVVVPALGHDYDFEAEGGYKGKAAPTCTTNAICWCGEELEGTAIGHSYVSVDAKTATCLEDGWDAFEYCENEGCEHTTFAGTLTKAAHWVEQFNAENYTKVEAVTATHSKPGNSVYYVCNDCNAVHKKATKTDVAVTEEVFEKDIVKTCKGTLKAQDKSDNAVLPTCEVDGQTAGGICSLCEEYVAPEVVEATGHKIADKDAATCTKNAKCSNSNCDYKATGRVLENTATGHVWEFVDVVYESCTVAGTKAHYECTNGCGLWAIENAEESEEKGKNDGWVDGYKEFRANDASFNLPKSGHGNFITVEAKAPTCSEKGWNAYKYCGQCDDYVVGYVELPATGKHMSNIDGKTTCSKFLVCETIISDKDLDEDGELDIIHVGCGAIYVNANPAFCVDTDDDGVCDVCGTAACKHADVNNDSKCDVCGECLHTAHDADGICKACSVKVGHNWVAEGTSYYCAGCNTLCAHNVHDVDLNCDVCGNAIVGAEHNYTGAGFTCIVCGAPCNHEAGFGDDIYCDACGEECPHTDHNSLTGVCYYCGSEVGHKYVGAAGEAWICSCGLVCDHSEHVQGEEGDDVFNTVCKNVYCNAPVKHTYDLTGVTTTTTHTNCLVCEREVKVSAVCPHTGDHYQAGACKVCGTAGVAVHNDANLDGKCDICGKDGVGAIITESKDIEAEITASKVNNVGQDSQWAVRVDGEEVEVTIVDGEYDAGNGATYNIAVWAANGSKVTINAGYFTTGKDATNGLNHVVYASGGATVVINGGTFQAKDGMDSSMLLNCQDGNGTIIITGGAFYNFDPSNNVAEGPNTNFVAPGYMVESEVVGNDTIYRVVPIN